MDPLCLYQGSASLPALDGEADIALHVPSAHPETQGCSLLCVAVRKIEQVEVAVVVVVVVVVVGVAVVVVVLLLLLRLLLLLLLYHASGAKGMDTSSMYSHAARNSGFVKRASETEDDECNEEVADEDSPSKTKTL